MTANNVLDQKLNALIERIFLFTIDRTAKRGKQLVFLEDSAAAFESSSTVVMNLEVLEQALFERIMLPTPRDFLIPNNIEDMADTPLAVETRTLVYLFSVYSRNEAAVNENDSVNSANCAKIRELILRNAATAVKQPALFDGQDLSAQLLDVFKDMSEDVEIKERFLSALSKEVMDEAEGVIAMQAFLSPMFVEAHKSLKAASLVSLDVWVLPFLQSFVADKTNVRLGEFLIDYSTPPANSSGLRYAESLLGQLLSLSIMPKTHMGSYEYFDNLQSVNITSYQSLAASLWNYLSTLQDRMHMLVKGLLLLGGAAKEKILSWIGNCLQANASRGQIWSSHAGAGLGTFASAPDSFMVGLAAILLRLCKPLLKPQLKVLIVDPTYCAVPDEKRAEKGIHMRELSKETCLLPTEDGESRITAEKYNFVTECFFMTHKAIDLAYRVCIEKLIRMNREMHRLQGVYQDTILQGGTDVASNIMQLLTTQTQEFLCLQNLIIEPMNDQLLMQFYEATAIWLSQVASRDPSFYTSAEHTSKGFAPQTAETITLPLDNPVPRVLTCIPEFLFENIVGYLSFAYHVDQQKTQTLDVEAQSAVFTMILIFMGSAERVRNPHVRARLAEGLESLLPKEGQMGFSADGGLFTRHPHRLEVVRNLLSVFVGIEMTGQSVQFEQKFNYRRPMYVIMDYLWQIEEQKECFKRLERQAVNEIEAVDPPLFLRFVNLLINDSIFLLDESLTNITSIRQMQAAQDNGEWDSLPAEERQQNMQNLAQLGMFAKFDNILGRDTIKLLKMLTSEMKGIFCHAMMVDRIAAMLNYFLLNLVGPKKGNFKVKDKKEFEFDPASTVLEISRIYVNLQECDAFCLAVANDGRSYSPELFEYAEQVLIRIGGGNLIGEINEFSQKVRRLEEQRKVNEEALVDPPDDFLDPIMSTLMVDPVFLPSSHITVDRSTIARHLLSDQSDPFNRSPLTMDQVRTDEDMKRRINAWIEERRAAYKAKTKQNE